jgi:hypothetical protein
MSDPKRLSLLKGSPHKFDQAGHGCCGPSGAIMGLLVHAKDEVDRLYACLHESGVYRKVPESDEVSTKLVKRMSVKILDETKPNFLDVKLAIGLLLIVKAALAAAKKSDLFKACETYSQLWEGWVRGDKLSNGTPFAPFSYKHGDIALTTAVTKFMLELVGFDGVEVKHLIPNDKLVAEKTKLDSLDTHTDLVNALTALLKGNQIGALVGVAKKAFLDQPKAAAYDYVAHWVYVPKQTAPKNVFDAEVWTWGDKTTFTKLLKDSKAYPAVYFPRVALPFKSWKKG